MRNSNLIKGLVLLFAIMITTPFQYVYANDANARYEQNKIDINVVVKTAQGEPVFGATVILKEDNTKGAISGMEGVAQLMDVDPNGTVTISMLGYVTVVEKIKNRTNISVTLEEDMLALSEVVVVGYGTQKKANLTGAVASIDTEVIQNRTQTNVVSALQGMVPGVTVISRPGETPSMNFRGRGNLGTSAPLYVVDGVIVDASFFSSLDPNSIENISFLKDAASSSIYGSRAAYGVVLVTTKKGKDGIMQVQYSGNVAMKGFTTTPEYVNSGDYAILANEAEYNSNNGGGKFQLFSQDEIDLFRNGSKPDLYPNSDWIDLCYDKQVVTTQHSVSFTGGTKKLSYYTGLGFLQDQSNMPGDDTKRYNFNTNISSDITDWLTFRTNIKYTYSKYNVEGGRPSPYNMMIVPVTFVGQHSNGLFGSVVAGKEAEHRFVTQNPLRQFSYGDWTNNKSAYGLYEGAIDIKPIEDLVITAQASFINKDYKNKSYTATRPDVPSFLHPGTIMPGSSDSKNTMYMSWGGSTQEIYNATANYKFNINESNSFNVLAGTSYEVFKNETLTAQRSGFPSDLMTDMSAGQASGPDYKNNSSSFEYKMMSYFGRINYDYKEKYLLELNVRADASSRFHKDNRWGYFPSVSAGWRLSEEAFAEGSKDWLSNLKLRASYGSLGNINNVGYYDYFANYGTNGYYPWGGTNGNAITESKPANPGLGWETVTMANIGVDFDLFNGKLSGTAEYYVKNTEDILLSYPVIVESGIGVSPSQNIGSVKNNGLEVALTHRNTVGEFTYSIGGNMSWNKNEITKLSDGDIIQGSSHILKYILKEGGEIGSFYGFETDGLYSEADIAAGNYYTYAGITPAAGDIKYVPQRDLEYGESINEDDRTVIGKDVPSVTYGINFSLSYKDFELSGLGQGVTGTSVAFDVYQMHPFFHGADNPRTFHLDRYTDENKNVNATYPKIYNISDPKTTSYNRAFNEHHVFDADYFRLKNITLAYNIPSKYLNKMKIQKLRVYLTGENLFTVRAEDRITDFDPETAAGVIYNYGVKTYAFGVNLTF